MRARRARPRPEAMHAIGVEELESLLTSYRHSETDLERELQPEVTDREAVGEVLTVGPLELAAHQHVLRRRAQQVAGQVLAALVGVRRLPVAVRDVDARVADRAGEPVVPRVIEIQ